MRWLILVAMGCVQQPPGPAPHADTALVQLGVFDQDGDGYAPGIDCDDERADVHPGATEQVGDGVDGDCDGVELCFTDRDRDGFGGVEIIETEPGNCVDPSRGLASSAVDCDDTQAWIHPGQPETPADGVDQDCDGAEACYPDEDADGWGASEVVLSEDLSCLDGQFAPRVGDCDDGDPSRHPSRLETCNQVDDDCDGEVDGLGSIDVVRQFRDQDGDGWGVRTEMVRDCPGRLGFARVAGDCDDRFRGAYPGAPEACDGVDNDCDVGVDEIDENSVAPLWYLDGDQDGLGDPSTVRKACEAPDALWVRQGGDCNDFNALQTETCPGCSHGPDPRSMTWLLVLAACVVPKRHGSSGLGRVRR